VEIPLGKWIETGFIAGFTDEVPEHIETKSITNVICSTPILAPYQLYLIESLAKRYMLPIHRVLGFFLTRPVISRLERTNFGTLEDKVKVDIPCHCEAWACPVAERGSNPCSVIANIWSDLVPEEKSQAKPSHIYFFHNSIITANLLAKYIQPRTVIICPDDISLFQYQKELVHDTYFFLPNEATDARRSKAWIDIRNGIPNVIFGTRKLLFSNLAQYDHIIYLEDAFFGEYFHYPTRIDYLDVLRILDATGLFQIDILTSTPLLKTLSTFRHFELENVV
jgi:primosomal protein N'